MSFLITLYAEDANLLRVIADNLTLVSARTGDPIETDGPVEVEAPGSLDIDLATIARSLWELLVAFGSLKASLETVELIVKILRERKPKGQTAKVEVVGPRDLKLILEGDISPEELTEVVKKYRAALQKLEPPS